MTVKPDASSSVAVSGTPSVKPQILVQTDVSGAVTTPASSPKFVVFQGRRGGKHKKLNVIQIEVTENTQPVIKNTKSDAYIVHGYVREVKETKVDKSVVTGGEAIGTGVFRPSENHTPRTSSDKSKLGVSIVKEEVVMSGTGASRPPEGQMPRLEVAVEAVRNFNGRSSTVDVSGTGSIRTLESHADVRPTTTRDEIDKWNEEQVQKDRKSSTALEPSRTSGDNVRPWTETRIPRDVQAIATAMAASSARTAKIKANTRQYVKGSKRYSHLRVEPNGWKAPDGNIQDIPTPETHDIPVTSISTTSNTENTGTIHEQETRMSRSRSICAWTHARYIATLGEDGCISVPEAGISDICEIKAKEPHFQTKEVISPFAPPNSDLDFLHTYFSQQGQRQRVHAYALVDGGAFACCMSLAYFQTEEVQGLRPRICKYSGPQVINASGKQMSPTLTAAMSVTAAGETCEWHFLIIEGLSQTVILGKDWLAHVRANTQHRAHSHTIMRCMRSNGTLGAAHTLDAHRTPLNAVRNVAVLTRDYLLSPMQTRICETKLLRKETEALKEGHTNILLVDAYETPEGGSKLPEGTAGVAVCSRLDREWHGFPIRNMTRFPITVLKGTPVAVMQLGHLTTQPTPFNDPAERGTNKVKDADTKGWINTTRFRVHTNWMR